MNHNEVRKGINKSRYYSNQGGLIFIEILAISAVAGIYFESWWIFLLAFIVTGVLFMSGIFGLLIPGLISLGIGLVVGKLIFEEFDSIGAAIVVGLFLSAGLFEIHRQHLVGFRDVMEE